MPPTMMAQAVTITTGARMDWMMWAISSALMLDSGLKLALAQDDTSN
jgi:hypothetical protein